MNIKEFAEKNGVIKDNLTHEEYYTKIVDLLGYNDVLKYVPYSIIEIRKAFPKDNHLNNLPLKKWDDMSGIGMKYNKGYGKMFDSLDLLDKIAFIIMGLISLYIIATTVYVVATL